MSHFDKLNSLGAQKKPFFFAISFDTSELLILNADELNENIAFDMNGIKSLFQPKSLILPKIQSTNPISFDEYKYRFNKLQERISCGDTYLANLTAQTRIKLSGDLSSIYTYAKAPFKLFMNNCFVSFSPERFINIINNTITTFPMKGTAIENSLDALLRSDKEMAEHTMSVDLLRNDMSLVASNVRLKEFRKATLIKAGDKKVWQTSSKISGELDNSWPNFIGDILAKLLPAGSISGTPKKMTVKILKEIEGYNRGFFTGIFGYFGGDFLDSAVAIRFIEQTNNGFVYKSGGGVTTNSCATDEYQELLTKIYLPF